MKSIRLILSSIRKADNVYNLINNKDTIAIGVSGGKDSMLLLYALTLYKQYSKINFNIIPFTIDLGFPGFNPSKISNFAANLGLNLEIVDAKKVYPILETQKELQKLPHLPCSICSKMKKASIIKSAKLFKCNKVAFAHHADDAIETLFLNEIYGGRMATFSPKMFLTRENITFIRPLILCRESEIKRAVKECDIPITPSSCPADGCTKREDIKILLNNIYDTYPESKSSFLRMVQNYEQMDLFFDDTQNKVLDLNKYYYKKIIKVEDFVQSMKFMEASKKSTEYNTNKYLQLDLSYFALYNSKDKIDAVISVSIKDKNYEIVSYKYFNYDRFEKFIFTLYSDLYQKINPFTLYISSNKKDFLNKIGFSRVFGKKHANSKNPIHIIHSLKD